MSASPSYESGLRPSRTEYVRESTAGVTPDNPSWNLFSDNVREVEADISGSVESQRGRGDPDSQNAFAGTEESTLTITYDLQQKTSSGNTFLDGSSNPNDAATDGLQRDSDNRIQNTHTIVDRIEQSSIDADNTVNGSNSKDTRQYIVAKGAYPDEVTLTGDPSDPQPITVEITYQCEKIRRLQIDQPPDSGKQIAVKSTDSNDTGVTVTIEGTNASGSAAEEDVSLDGTDATTLVDTDTSFQTIDAVEPGSETAGDVEVYEDDDGTNDAVTQGDQLATIQGQNSYDHGEGDLGIKALGTGSHASAIGQDFELYHDDSVDRPNGTTIADGYETTEFAVANNVEATEQGGTPRPALAAGDREVEVSSTVFGETEAVTRTVDHLTTATENTRWTVNGGYLEASTADVREVGSPLSPSEGKAMTDLTLNGQGLTVSA